MKIPKRLFHFTNERNIASIVANGLKATEDYILAPDNRLGVNLCTNSYYAFGHNNHKLEVDTAKLDAASFENYKSGWWRYFKDIPASAIKDTGKTA